MADLPLPACGCSPLGPCKYAARLRQGRGWYKRVLHHLRCVLDWQLRRPKAEHLRVLQPYQAYAGGKVRPRSRPGPGTRSGR